MMWWIGMWRAVRRGLGCGLWCLGVGSTLACVTSCATDRAARAPRQAEWTVAALYPLQADNAWSYEVDTGTGSPLLTVVRVERLVQDEAWLRSGQEPVHYRMTETSLVRTSDAHIMLKAPLAPGASWDSAPGTQARVLNVVERVTTPAGSFRDCLEIEERTPTRGKRVTTTYCPQVGPVRVTSALSARGATVQVDAVLRGYQVARP